MSCELAGERRPRLRVQRLQPPVEGAIGADVCVIGAGITGVSAALNLAERGFSVAVLEASKVGWAASGRNGGQMIGGFACGMDTFAKTMSPSDVKLMWELGRETLDIVTGRIERHRIDCELTLGYLTAADKPPQLEELGGWRDQTARDFGYDPFRIVQQ